jgi:hypothetical protein
LNLWPVGRGGKSPIRLAPKRCRRRFAEAGDSGDGYGAPATVPRRQIRRSVTISGGMRA